MATGGPGAGRPSARWWPTHRPFWAPSSVTNASAPRVYQRVVCHEIRSKLSPPMDCSGASTRFLASRKVAPPPAPPQRRSSMRADPPAGRISRNASLGSHDAWRRRATRRTRWLVVQGRRFPSTAGMDSGEINTRVSGALCGRRSEGTAFASCSARRTRGSSGKHENGKKNADWSHLSRILSFSRRVRVPVRGVRVTLRACGTPRDAVAGPYRAWVSSADVVRARRNLHFSVHHPKNCKHCLNRNAQKGKGARASKTRAT